MYGYKNANIIELIPITIVKILNCIKIKKAKKHRDKTYKRDLLTDINPAAKGLFMVLLTFLSISLSTTSLKIHPALLINTEPRKKRTR